MPLERSLWPFLRSIATGDRAAISRLLRAHPELSGAALPAGATRAASTPYFIEEIQHYLYAGDTALHVAAAAYSTDVARELLANDADINARNRRGAQPLHYASVGQPGSASWAPESQAEVVRFLLESGAHANATDKNGVMPVHLAVRTRCAAAVRALLTHGADPRARNGSGSTPLHLAVQNTGRGGSGSPLARKQQDVIIRLLVAHGARPTDQDARGKRVTECTTSERLLRMLGT